MEPVDNRKILANLEQEISLLKAAYGVSTGAMIGGTVSSNPLVAGIGAAGDYFILERLEKISRIQRVATMLVDAFESTGVTIFPRVQVPGRNPLDLFVRFNKTNLIISIRSMGKSSIVFNEKQNSLYVRKPNNKGLKIWRRPDPLEELSEYIIWVNKNRALFGFTARQVRQPRAKVLLISGETKIHKHNEHLYTTLGDKTFLAIPKFGTIFVIREEKLIDFAEAFLASQNTSLDLESLNPVSLS
jgi:hypothetical protein